MSRIELPEGQWAEIVNPRKVTERKRRLYLRAMAEYQQSREVMAGFGPEQQRLLDDAFDLLIVALVQSWSFEQPVSVEAFADLPADVFDPLRKACMALAAGLLPDYGPAATEDDIPATVDA